MAFNNNIDGFQTNFDEFKNHCLNFNMSYIFYCLNKTNFNSDNRNKYKIAG